MTPRPVGSFSNPSVSNIYLNADLSHSQKTEKIQLWWRGPSKIRIRNKNSAESNHRNHLFLFLFTFTHYSGGHLNLQCTRKMCDTHWERICILLWLDKKNHISVKRDIIKKDIRNTKEAFIRFLITQRSLKSNVTDVNFQTANGKVKTAQHAAVVWFFFFVSWQERLQPLASFPQLIKWSRLKRKKTKVIIWSHSSAHCAGVSVPRGCGWLSYWFWVWEAASVTV